MYLRKIMVYNVTTFSYNRATPGGALYLGNIGSPKDRCVSDTCEKKIQWSDENWCIQGDMAVDAEPLIKGPFG